MRSMRNRLRKDMLRRQIDRCQNSLCVKSDIRYAYLPLVDLLRNNATICTGDRKNRPEIGLVVAAPCVRGLAVFGLAPIVLPGVLGTTDEFPT
jgi:hypothetical protein